LNTRYLNQITTILDSQNLNYEVLYHLSIEGFQDYVSYYLLVEGSILYVASIGKTDQQKSQLFFDHLGKAFHSKKNQKLTLILDISQLSNIPDSPKSEVQVLDFPFEKYCSQVLFIYQGIAKSILDRYEHHSSEHEMTIEKIVSPKLAIEHAINDLNHNQTSERDLNSLSKEELIVEVKRLRNGFDYPPKPQIDQAFHQEASLRSIFDSLDSMIWMVDAQFNLMAFNSKFYQHLIMQYGITPQVGMNVLDQTELAGQYEKTIQRISIALNGKEENYRDFYQENEEIIKVVDSKIFPVVLNNEITGVACLTNDITENFKVKEKIKSNESIISSVNKNISEAIYRSSHGKGLVFINKAFVKMFGYDSKEELYKNSGLNRLYANPDDRERLGKLLIRKNEVTNMEVQFRKKDGKLFTGLISSMVSEDENGIKYFDGAIRDVTAIKSAQEKLKKQNRELKKLNTELDSFVYSASHDLKAPLSSVKGLINLAKNENNKEKLTNYLNLVDKSINKLDDFIKDIVDLSRNARQDIQAEQIDFHELVDDTLSNHQYLENYDKINKQVNIENGVGFYSDKRRLKVILNNLISNSIRYFNPFIDNPQVEIYIKAEKKKAIVKITDNGLGIEPQYLEKIFEMFFRASNNSKGTGIGLYIVKETVQKIKGKIDVESEVEKGTTFSVVIPNMKG